MTVTAGTTKSVVEIEGGERRTRSSHDTQQPSSVSSLRQSKRSTAPTIISPRTRGNAIARVLASPGDLLHENNLDNNVAADGHERNNTTQNKFITPSKRSTAEAALHLLARKRTTTTKSLETVKSKVDVGPKQTQAADDAAISSSSLTTPGGRRRKRKAARDAQSKVRDICEMEDFDHLDELLMSSSQKIPYNESSSSSLTVNQGGRRKRIRRGGNAGGAGAGSVVSDFTVVADRPSATLSFTSSETKDKDTDSLITTAATNNDTVVDTAVAVASSFVPVGKLEERWFRNFQKWRYNSFSSSSTKSPANTSTTLVAASVMPPPTSPPPKLWIREQRVQYNLWRQDKKSQLTKERIKLLESAGFCWDDTEWRKNGKGVITSSVATTKKSMNSATSRTNIFVNDVDSKGHAISEDAHQSVEEKRDRHSEKRTSPRKGQPTQLYLNLGGGSNSLNDNRSRILRESIESAVNTTTPPKVMRKKERRGRHGMSTLEVLDTSGVGSLSGDGNGGTNAAAKRSKSLSYKELDMAVNKSLQHKARNNARKATSTKKKVEDKRHGERKVNDEGNVPLITCNDLSPSLESPLLVTTRLSASLSSTTANNPEPVCVRDLILSCLSDESPPDGRGTISIRSDENPKSSMNGFNINDGTSLSTSMNANVGHESSKRMMDGSVSVEPNENMVLKSSVIASRPDSPRPITRQEPTLLDNTTNIDSGSNINQRPATSYDDTCLDSPWEHDDGDTFEPTDLLPNCPDQSKDINSSRRLFSSPVVTSQSQTWSPPVAESIRKESTQTADCSFQTLVNRNAGNLNRIQANLNPNGDPTNDLNTDECSMQISPPSTLGSPFDNVQRSQNRILHESAANADSKEADTQLANPIYRNLVSSSFDSRHNGNLPVICQAVGPSLPVVMAERQYQAAMTNYGQLEIEMKLVAQRMREIEASMKLVDASSMAKNTCIESERCDFSTKKVPYHTNSRPRSTSDSHHSSSSYYESSEDEYNDEFYLPSPIRQRRSTGYLGPNEIIGNRSRRRSDAHKTSGRRGRSRSYNDVRRNGRSNYYGSGIRKISRRKLKIGEQYQSDSSYSSDDFADYGDDRYQAHGQLKTKRLGRITSQDSELIASSREPRRNRKQKRRHPVSILENTNPRKPTIADNQKSPQNSGRSSSARESVDKPLLLGKVNKEISTEIQRNDTKDDREVTTNDTANVTNVRITSCALGGRAREPLFWLARGESSSDDESWDFDGPMILPPPPL
jgi:hypothetical protein